MMIDTRSDSRLFLLLLLLILNQKVRLSYIPLFPIREKLLFIISYLSFFFSLSANSLFFPFYRPLKCAFFIIYLFILFIMSHQKKHKQVTFKVDRDFYHDFELECKKQHKTISECLREGMYLWLEVNREVQKRLQKDAEQLKIKIEKGPSLRR